MTRILWIHGDVARIADGPGVIHRRASGNPSIQWSWLEQAAARTPGEPVGCDAATSLRTWCLVALLTLPVAAWGGEAGKLKILLLGDSTTIGSVCRQADPDGPHLEDVIRLLLATEKDLPPS